MELTGVDLEFLKKWGDNFDTNIDNNFYGNWLSYQNFINIQSKRYMDKPWVVCAAGPSLDKQLQTLLINRNKVYVVCVDIVVFRLVEIGIYPDIVVNIDPSDFNPFWNNSNNWHGENSILICPATTHPNNLEWWKGKKHIFRPVDYTYKEKYETLKKLTKACKNSGELVNAGFVGATILHIVKDARPIKVGLIGWDFAYTDNKVYCDGVLERRYFDDYDGTRKQAEFDKKNMIIGSVWTTVTLNMYMNIMITIVNKWHIKLYNCTEGGILKDSQYIHSINFIPFLQ